MRLPVPYGSQRRRSLGSKQWLDHIIGLSVPAQSGGDRNLTRTQPGRNTRMTTYRGVDIERVPTGWWVAWFVPNCPYPNLKADTLSGMKAMIRDYCDSA